jgi:hypothetical protein
MIRLLTDYVQPTTTDPQLLDSGSVGGPLAPGVVSTAAPDTRPSATIRRVAVTPSTPGPPEIHQHHIGPVSSTAALW